MVWIDPRPSADAAKKFYAEEYRKQYKATFKPKIKHAYRDMNFYEEEDYGWLEGEGWLPLLLPLREDILKQDYRILYLAWLHAIMLAYEEDLSDSIKETPAPPGLNQLSRPLQEFIKLFEVNEYLIHCAVKRTGKSQTLSEMEIKKAISSPLAGYVSYHRLIRPQ